MTEYLLPTDILAAYLIFKLAALEAQRLARAHASGIRGSSELFAFFLQVSVFIAMVFGFAWIVAIAYDFGIIPAFSTLAIGLVATIFASMIIPESLVVHLVCVLAIWPLGFFLAGLTSWFGMVAS